MKRFYREAAIGEGGTILLDGRPVRTPARATLALPTSALAAAVVAEWNAQADSIAPATMPLTGLANAAIDRVAPDLGAFADGIGRYAEADLLAYRANGPAELVRRQAERWEPLLAWAEARFDIRFAVTTGIVHRPQPAETVGRLRQVVAARDAFALAALSPLVTVGGSLVVALAVAEGHVDADEGFAATQVDEDWQAETWGHDPLAEAARGEREAAFRAAARFLSLLGEGYARPLTPSAFA